MGSSSIATRLNTYTQRRFIVLTLGSISDCGDVFLIDIQSFCYNCKVLHGFRSQDYFFCPESFAEREKPKPRWKRFKHLNSHFIFFLGTERWQRPEEEPALLLLLRNSIPIDLTDTVPLEEVEERSFDEQPFNRQVNFDVCKRNR